MAITIREIAALAKVSKGTVSKVMNDAPGVGAETRARILRLIQELDFQPNASARGLAAKRTGNIGVIIPHTGNYSMASAYWPILLTSITDEAAARGLNVLLSTARSEEDVDSAYRSILRGRRVDGLIVSAEQFGQKQVAELLVKGFPFVMVGRSPVLSHFHVDVDNTGGAEAMTRHLIALGHRQIAMLAGPSHYPSVQERVSAFERTMRAAGLTRRVQHCAYHAEAASGSVKQLMSIQPRATALFVAAGDLVTATLGTLAQLGLRIPSDVAMGAFDDHPDYAHFSPAITAVRQPIHDCGQAAVEMLFALMDGKEPAIRAHVLPTRLVIRRSCGAEA